MAIKCVRRAIWRVLHADDVCVVSRSPRGLERMIAVSVEVFGAFSLAISESKTETMCIPIPRAPATQIPGSLQRHGATEPPDNALLQQAPYNTSQDDDVASNPRSLAQVAEQPHPFLQRSPPANPM